MSACKVFRSIEELFPELDPKVKSPLRVAGYTPRAAALKQFTILHTIEGGGPGGAETVLFQLASNLNPDRFRSIVLLSSDDWLKKQLGTQSIETTLVKSKAWYDFRLPMAMTKLIRKEKVDLIHSHLSDQNFYSCIAALLTSRKIVVTYHGTPGLATQSRVRSAIKLWTVRNVANSVVVVSDFLRGVLESLGFPPQKIVRIYNGVNMKMFISGSGGRLRKELRLADDAKLVGMVANLRESKGYEFFVQAARQVADSVPEARFLAVGEKDTGIAKQLESLVLRLNLNDRFFFLGFRSDVAEILQNLDVFVLSSVSEGLSIATIEAMAAGKPVVVTRSGGPQEIVQDGRTGILVEPADPAALGSKICEVLRNPELAASLSRNARAEVEEKFSLKKMVSEYEALYEHCLGSA